MNGLEKRCFHPVIVEFVSFSETGQCVEKADAYKSVDLHGEYAGEVFAGSADPHLACDPVREVLVL